MNLRQRIVLSSIFGMLGVLCFHFLLLLPLLWGYKVEWLFPYELVTVGVLGVVFLGGIAVDVFRD